MLRLGLGAQQPGCVDLDDKEEECKCLLYIKAPVGNLGTLVIWAEVCCSFVEQKVSIVTAQITSMPKLPTGTLIELIHNTHSLNISL